MYAPADNIPPARSGLMKVLVSPWGYRHLRFSVGVRIVAGIWNLGVGALALSYGYWLGAVPLAGSAVLFWVAYRLQHGVRS
jgi:hypothetical protein